ncbi:MAG: hypothetical protein ACK6D5_17500, partial [Planctomyces sp.]
LPESENPFARSLMEKAGLEVRRPKSDSAADLGKPAPKKQTRRVSSEDDFIMDWLKDESSVAGDHWPGEPRTLVRGCG